MLPATHQLPAEVQIQSPKTPPERQVILQALSLTECSSAFEIIKTRAKHTLFLSLALFGLLNLVLLEWAVSFLFQ